MKLKFTLYQLLIITLMMAGAAFCAHGQNTVIRGEVSDSKTGKPLQLIEGSVGVSNIFKLLRVDYVRRFTYLDHPDAARSGVRFFMRFDF